MAKRFSEKIDKYLDKGDVGDPWKAVIPVIFNLKGFILD
jgi:hypothetical protein